MRVEIHQLQQFPPSCLNRDDTGAPKSCIFGGYPRARLSSQCLKRAMRDHMNGIGGLEAGVRSRILAQRLAELLHESHHRDKERAELLSRLALRAARFSMAPEAPQKTLAQLFLSPREIMDLATAVDADWDALEQQQQAHEQQATEKKKKPAAKPAPENGEKKKEPTLLAPHTAAAVGLMQGAVSTADIALFGRMVAENTHMQVNAAAQVAHALSTNEVNGSESDYFTAVDDLQVGDDKERGAAMIGNIEFCSACFYRYAVVDHDRLATNLGGDTRFARRVIVAFVAAAIEALPTGRQNSTAAHSAPDYVEVVIRPSLCYSLANAFEAPIQARREKGSLRQLSIHRLREYQAGLEQLYPAAPGTARRAISTLEGVGTGSAPELLAWLDQQLAGAG